MLERKQLAARALAACALLAAPIGAAHPTWRETHSAHSSAARSAPRGRAPVLDSPAPHVRTEVGMSMPAKEPVLWSLIPAPFSEEMQKLASKGDSHALLAPQKYDGFRAWKSKYRANRPYASVAEEVQAFRAFIENDQVIETHNADHASSYYSLGHSEWSAHSFHEFENLMFPVKTQDIMPPVYASSGQHVYTDADGKPKPIPDFVDWTQENVVSPVANQGECGSCWCARAGAADPAEPTRARRAAARPQPECRVRSPCALTFLSRSPRPSRLAAGPSRARARSRASARSRATFQTATGQSRSPRRSCSPAMWARSPRRTRTTAATAASRRTPSATSSRRAASAPRTSTRTPPATATRTPAPIAPSASPSAAT